MGCECNTDNNLFQFRVPSSDFQVPNFGTFSPTIWGMVNSDYRFYQPVQSLDMYCYPNNSYSTPGGINFDSNLYYNMINQSINQTNWQSQTNPMFNTPWANNGNNNTTSPTPTTPEEKEAKKDYDNLKTFLEDYASYKNRDGVGRGDTVKGKLKEINSLQIKETQDDGTTKERPATYQEKLDELNKYYKELERTEKSDMQNYIVSGRFGGTSCSSAKLAEIGYEIDSQMDGWTEKAKEVLKDKKSTEDQIKSAQIPSTVTKNNVLDMVSAYNSNCSSRLIEDMVWCYQNTTNKKGNKAKDKAKANLDRIKQSLIERANSAKEYLKADDGSREAFNKLIDRLKKYNKYDSGLSAIFNDLYAATRIVEAREVVNNLEYKYGKVLPGMFKFIVDNTEEDLKSEGLSQNMISWAKEKVTLAKSNGQPASASTPDEDPEVEVVTGTVTDAPTSAATPTSDDEETTETETETDEEEEFKGYETLGTQGNDGNNYYFKTKNAIADAKSDLETLIDEMVQYLIDTKGYDSDKLTEAKAQLLDTYSSVLDKIEENITDLYSRHKARGCNIKDISVGGGEGEEASSGSSYTISVIRAATTSGCDEIQDQAGTSSTGLLVKIAGNFWNNTSYQIEIDKAVLKKNLLLAAGINNEEDSEHSTANIDCALIKEELFSLEDCGWDTAKRKAIPKLCDVGNTLKTAAINDGYSEEDAESARKTFVNYYTAVINAFSEDYKTSENGLKGKSNLRHDIDKSEKCYFGSKTAKYKDADGNEHEIGAQTPIKALGRQFKVNNLGGIRSGANRYGDGLTSETGLYIGCDNTAKDSYWFFFDTNAAKAKFKSFLQ